MRGNIFWHRPRDNNRKTFSSPSPVSVVSAKCKCARGTSRSAHPHHVRKAFFCPPQTIPTEYLPEREAWTIHLFGSYFLHGIVGLAVPMMMMMWLQAEKWLPLVFERVPSLLRETHKNVFNENRNNKKVLILIAAIETLFSLSSSVCCGH